MKEPVPRRKASSRQISEPVRACNTEMLIVFSPAAKQHRTMKLLLSDQ
jgi:hypothetical protein